MKKVAVIMAGGAGERFWPFSRKARPKQLLTLTGHKSMLADSLDKISGIIPIEDCYIVTNSILKDAILKDIPNIPVENILCEPMGKNTAPCLGFAAAVFQAKYEDCVVAVLTADHLIMGEEAFQENIKLALKTAKKEDAIVVLGIPPNRPETGYGYIQIEDWIEKTSSGWVAEVKGFHEKPDIQTAKHYLSSGNYFWNCGMFFWRNSVIIDAFGKYMPKLYYGIQKISNYWNKPDTEKIVKEVFEELDSISIDYGILEKFPQIRMVRADFNWDDVGSWASLERINESDENGNLFIGDCIAIDTKNTIAFTDMSATSSSTKPLIGLIGMSDCVVVTSGNCVLVCPKNRVQDVKKIVTELNKQNKKEHV